MQILVTGAAGFIGAELSLQLLALGHEVDAVDNLNSYYKVQLKRDRLERLTKCAERDRFRFIELDICDAAGIAGVVSARPYDVVVHLAAQAGVRYSIEKPHEYFQSNLLGFGNMLEACRQANITHLVYASSSSVYGANRNFPFKESDPVDTPVSLYAATKKSNELMAHSYSHLYDMRCTGLRFFTVYGPWGRPDMAPFRFASRILNGEAIPVYNQGKMIRDFTYISDICEGVINVIKSDAVEGEALSEIYNIGRGEAVELMDFISTLEESLGEKAKINYLPMQDGDVQRTMADCSKLARRFNYRPRVSIAEGVHKFAQWYMQYYEN